MGTKKSKDKKTNVMRLLDQAGIAYTSHNYESTGAISGVEVAAALGQDPAKTFKTLVTHGRQEYYVFIVPVAAELDLKKAAAAVGEKSIEMIKQKELLPLTGYVHGGCSPIGMKKPFRKQPFLFIMTVTVPSGSRCNLGHYLHCGIIVSDCTV